MTTVEANRVKDLLCAAEDRLALVSRSLDAISDDVGATSASQLLGAVDILTATQEDLNAAGEIVDSADMRAGRKWRSAGRVEAAEGGS